MSSPRPTSTRTDPRRVQRAADGRSGDADRPSAVGVWGIGLVSRCGSRTVIRTTHLEWLAGDQEAPSARRRVRPTCAKVVGLGSASKIVEPRMEQI